MLTSFSENLTKYAEKVYEVVFQTILVKVVRETRPYVSNFT